MGYMVSFFRIVALLILRPQESYGIRQCYQNLDLSHVGTYLENPITVDCTGSCAISQATHESSGIQVTIQMCTIVTYPDEKCASGADLPGLTSEYTVFACYCNTNLCNTDLNAVRRRIGYQSQQSEQSGLQSVATKTTQMDMQSVATKTTLLFSNWLLIVYLGIYIRKVIV